jgi:hypothetical protein
MNPNPRLGDQHGHEHGFGELAKTNDGMGPTARHKIIEWPDEGELVLGKNERLIELEKVLTVHQIPIGLGAGVPVRLEISLLLLVD